MDSSCSVDQARRFTKESDLPSVRNWDNDGTAQPMPHHTIKEDIQANDLTQPIVDFDIRAEVAAERVG
tara:strand:+ start:15489 stop:15692 length:204 start_codon:yes stop_codon:yes gene_type:complete